MQGQLLRTTDTTPSVDLFFFDADALPVTSLVHDTAGLTLAYQRAFNTAPVALTLAAQTVTGAWAAGGFVHRGGGVYRLDLPTAANASGLPSFEVLATALPVGVRMAPMVVVLTPDDVTVAGPSVAAIEGALADNISAVPAAVVTGMRAETVTTAWGVTSTPVGGSSRTIPERRGGTVIGTRTAFFDASTVCVGMTEAV